MFPEDPHWDDATENKYEDSLIGSGEAFLPPHRLVEKELEFLRELKHRNLQYPQRTAAAEDELRAIEAEIERWSRLVEA